jgi:hypothetical protein
LLYTLLGVVEIMKGLVSILIGLMLFFVGATQIKTEVNIFYFCCVVGGGLIGYGVKKETSK